MVTQAQISYSVYQRMKQSAAIRRKGSDYFKPFWKTKKGHWKLVYPGIDEIEGMRCRITVKCLDCGVVIERPVGDWLVYRNFRGCSSCRGKGLAPVLQIAEQLESSGFKLLEKEKSKRDAYYKIRHEKCHQVFVKRSGTIGSFLSHGARCPICLNKSLPKDIIRIRLAHVNGGVKYTELSEQAHYALRTVEQAASGWEGDEQTFKYIADVAERIAKEESDDKVD